MQAINVSAEIWFRLAGANSAKRAALGNKDAPLKVKHAEYGGFLYTTFSVTYGGYGATERPRLDAIRLLPVGMWSGEVFETIKQLDRRIERDERLRGSYLGLMVEVYGEKMVCAKASTFVMGLPKTRPVSLDDAESYDRKQARAGWRAIFFKGAKTSWASLEGHPVIVYENHRTGARRSVLVWRDGKSTRDLIIGDDVPLGGRDVLREREMGDQLFFSF